MKPNMQTITQYLTVIVALWAGSLLAQTGGQDNEGLGKLKLGQPAAKVIEVLGTPKSKGKDQLWEAIGEWVQDWEFPAQGLTIAMTSNDKGGAKTIHSLTAKSGCPLATARGIKVGSTEASARTAYQDVEDKEQPKREHTFVAGSIYGGVIFTFKAGKVSEIFIGAAAE